VEQVASNRHVYFDTNIPAGDGLGKFKESIAAIRAVYSIPHKSV